MYHGAAAQRSWAIRSPTADQGERGAIRRLDLHSKVASQGDQNAYVPEELVSLHQFTANGLRSD